MPIAEQDRLRWKTEALDKALTDRANQTRELEAELARLRADRRELSRLLFRLLERNERLELSRSLWAWLAIAGWVAVVILLATEGE